MGDGEPKREGGEGKDKNYDEEEEENRLDLGPICSIREHLEKDKDDESLRKWKEQLLGNVDDAGGETMEPEVKILSLTILSPGRPDLELSIPESGDVPKGLWFTLKEDSPYVLRFTFTVKNNIVSGLKYINNVWKTGLKVDTTREMLGAFSPQQEPYTHKMPEETTPSGYFARGTYSAKTRFVDDDNKCYLEMNYTFDIQKDWASN